MYARRPLLVVRLHPRISTRLLRDIYTEASVRAHVGYPLSFITFYPYTRKHLPAFFLFPLRQFTLTVCAAALLALLSWPQNIATNTKSPTILSLVGALVVMQLTSMLNLGGGGRDDDIGSLCFSPPRRLRRPRRRQSPSTCPAWVFRGSGKPLSTVSATPCRTFRRPSTVRRLVHSNVSMHAKLS